MSNKLLGSILAITGILLFSSKAVLVKLAYSYEADAITVLLLRMLFALPFYLVIAFLKKQKAHVEKKDYLWLVGFGVMGYYLASYLDFKGLEYIKASLERLILFVYPTLVILISYFIMGTRITQKQVAGVVITYLGIMVIFYPEIRIGQTSHILLGGVLIFLSAVTYAGYLVGSGWLIPKFGATVFTSYAMIVSCLCVILHHSISSSQDLLEQPEEVYWLGLGMAVFATVIPSYLISYAIKLLGASDFSIFGALGPVSTIGLAYLFLDETLTIIQIVGASIVIGGVVWAQRPPS